jgi:hypothetical protein
MTLLIQRDWLLIKIIIYTQSNQIQTDPPKKIKVPKIFVQSK